MARLTPFAKVLIGVIVIGGAGAVGYNLVKNNGAFSAAPVAANASTTHASKSAPAAQPYVAPPSKNDAMLRLGINSFHGFAPGLVANGNSLRTKPDSIFAKQGLDLEFVIQDDIPTLDTIFTSGTAQCTWRTSDFWAQEQPNLRNAGLDARAIMAVDNTQGADAIIARDPAVRRIEDLAGKRVALLQYTPSHGMLIDAIENSSLSERAKQSIQMVFINADEGMTGVGAALTSGAVDAAVMWDPDLSMVTKRNAHVIYSTKIASNLIFDLIVCDKRFLDTPAGKAAAQKLVAGWMEGVKAARADKGNAAKALVATLPYYEMLVKDQGMPFLESLFGNLVWTGLEDNARIFGLVGGTNHYERVYRRFDGIYRSIGALANPKSPVIAPQDSVDYSYIRDLLAANHQAEASARAEQANAQTSFTVEAQQAAVAAAPAAVTKPVSVNFETGSARLTKRAQQVINEQMVPFIENNGTAYFEVSGNTDSTGSLAANMTLSRARAQAVVDYLATEWEFPRTRFHVIGNGPKAPLCDEGNPQSSGLGLEDCRAANRTTRVAVYSAR
ncbi:MAG: phosphate ABC transporter substrate-binding/OmpA family protein [Desulfovibrionaceae bacterium]|nr:phosphate ABC transporter substrate-binding/OmpA family protein [Desulfovibrionaceae bacterium]